MKGTRSRLWDVHVGGALGARHRTIGLPYQDAVAFRGQADNGPLVVAVADGHGSPRHFRSERGAALAVEVGCEAALYMADRLPEHLEDLADGIVRDWRQAVIQDTATRPYSNLEQAKLDILGDEPEVSYGSTLLVCLAMRPWLVFAQVGDGDVLAVLPDGRALSPVPWDDRLEGVITTSLCLPDAEHDFRFGVCDLDETPVRAVLLATDGYSNAQRAEPWQPTVAADLARQADEHDARWFDEQVPRWAQKCASSAGSGDDTTLALLVDREP